MDALYRVRLTLRPRCVGLTNTTAHCSTSVPKVLRAQRTRAVGVGVTHLDVSVPGELVTGRPYVTLLMGCALQDEHDGRLPLATQQRCTHPAPQRHSQDTDRTQIPFIQLNQTLSIVVVRVGCAKDRWAEGQHERHGKRLASTPSQTFTMCVCVGGGLCAGVPAAVQCSCRHSMYLRAHPLPLPQHTMRPLWDWRG